MRKSARYDFDGLTLTEKNAYHVGAWRLYRARQALRYLVARLLNGAAPVDLRLEGYSKVMVNLARQHAARQIRRDNRAAIAHLNVLSQDRGM